MRAIDANVLVRLLAQDDPAQEASAVRFIEQGAWVPVLALAEAVWVLNTVYKQGPRVLSHAIEMLLKHKNVTIEDSDAVEAALVLFRSHPSAGFSDCLMLELSRKAGHLPLGTFDRALAKLPGAVKL